MPIYNFECEKCGLVVEEILPMGEKLTCCGEVMTRLYTGNGFEIKVGYPRWVDRMDDIHKAQEQRGERLRSVRPWEILHNWDKDKQKALQEVRGRKA